MISASTIKTLLEISGTAKDAIITATIPVAEEIVCDILGLRALDSTAYTETLMMRLDQRNGDYYMYPSAIPVIAITALTSVDDDALSYDADIASDAPIRVNFDADGTDFLRHVKMSYTAGFANEGAVPSSIKMCVALLVQAMIEPKTNGVASYSIGQTSVSFGSQSRLEQFKTFEKAILKKYKRASIHS